jgi:hypothetical protein
MTSTMAIQSTVPDLRCCNDKIQRKSLYMKRASTDNPERCKNDSAKWLINMRMESENKKIEADRVFLQCEAHCVTSPAVAVLWLTVPSAVPEPERRFLRTFSMNASPAL